MFLSAFWSVDSFTGKVIKNFSFANFQTLFTQSVYARLALRSLSVALIVTLIDALLAIPIAFFMAKVLPPKLRSFAVVLVVLPLWASYLVKTYAWRTMFSNEGVIDWLLKPLGITSPGYGLFATSLTLAYLWLPYMILPIYAGQIGRAHV